MTGFAPVVIIGAGPNGLALAAQALARAHARTGDAAALACYLGTGAVFDEAVARFAAAYAANNLRDHAALVEAIAAGPAPSRSRS